MEENNLSYYQESAIIEIQEIGSLGTNLGVNYRADSILLLILQFSGYYIIGT